MNIQRIHTNVWVVFPDVAARQVAHRHGRLAAVEGPREGDVDLVLRARDILAYHDISFVKTGTNTSAI